jgi:hypothetical protein
MVNSFEVRVAEVWLRDNYELDVDGNAMKIMPYLDLITVLLNVCMIWL